MKYKKLGEKTLIQKLKTNYIEETSNMKKLVQAGIVFAAGVGLTALMSYCFSGSDHAKSSVPPEQLEQTIMRLAPAAKARVVYHIAKDDQLNKKGAKSASTLFLESYIRQKKQEGE